MTIYFSSDHHFYHSKILTYCNRPFKCASEAAEVMLERWNSTVKSNDSIYYLGDLAFLSKSQMKRFVPKLNGKIHIVQGNHDYYVNKPGIAERFEWVKNYFDLTIQDPEAKGGKQLIVLCHYPLLSWRNMSYWTWMLHGHCHSSINNVNEKIKRLDVGVDNFNFYPVSYEQVKQIMQKKENSLI